WSGSVPLKWAVPSWTMTWGAWWGQGSDAVRRRGPAFAVALRSSGLAASPKGEASFAVASYQAHGSTPPQHQRRSPKSVAEQVLIGQCADGSLACGSELAPPHARARYVNPAPGLE